MSAVASRHDDPAVRDLLRPEKQTEDKPWLMVPAMSPYRG